MKKNLLIAIALSLVIGFGGGYLLANRGSNTEKDYPHTDSSMKPHGMYEVSSANAPMVSFSVAEDAKSGWNITIDTRNFTFTPKNVNQANVEGEGHAHLYIEGEKIARLYGPYFHYAGDFDGTKTFRVTLNANDHSEYAIDGKVIEASLPVTHEDHN